MTTDEKIVKVVRQYWRGLVTEQELLSQLYVLQDEECDLPLAQQDAYKALRNEFMDEPCSFGIHWMQEANRVSPDAPIRDERIKNRVHVAALAAMQQCPKRHSR